MGNAKKKLIEQEYPIIMETYFRENLKENEQEDNKDKDEWTTPREGLDPGYPGRLCKQWTEDDKGTLQSIFPWEARDVIG